MFCSCQPVLLCDFMYAIFIEPALDIKSRIKYGSSKRILLLNFQLVLPRDIVPLEIILRTRAAIFVMHR